MDCFVTLEKIYILGKSSTGGNKQIKLFRLDLAVSAMDRTCLFIHFPAITKEHISDVSMGIENAVNGQIYGLFYDDFKKIIT